EERELTGVRIDRAHVAEVVAERRARLQEMAGEIDHVARIHDLNADTPQARHVDGGGRDDGEQHGHPDQRCPHPWRRADVMTLHERFRLRLTPSRPSRSTGISHGNLAPVRRIAGVAY